MPSKKIYLYKFDSYYEKNYDFLIGALALLCKINSMTS